MFHNVLPNNILTVPLCTSISSPTQQITRVLSVLLPGSEGGTAEVKVTLIIKGFYSFLGVT